MTSPGAPLALEWLPGRHAICRLAPDAAVPGWATARHGLLCITRTDRELSIVTGAAAVPPGVRAEGPWCAVRVRGPLDFGLIGILARLTTALADAGIATFAISTYDTDYLLVREHHRERAERALARAGRQPPATSHQGRREG